jgi:hypothetical protein
MVDQALAEGLALEGVAVCLLEAHARKAGGLDHDAPALVIEVVPTGQGKPTQELVRKAAAEHHT